MARGQLLDHLADVAAVLEGRRIGLLLDVDGTISEMVPDPWGAVVSEPIRATLHQLHGTLPLVAIVTGRASLQARDIVGVPELTYVGDHGLERLEGGRVSLAEGARPFQGELSRLRSGLEERFRSSGLVVEDKGGSFAIHYRLAGNQEEARDAALEAIEVLSKGRFKVVMGKTVINVLPSVPLTKGTAAAALIKEHGLTGAIAMGDDLTDLDLFRAVTEASHGTGFSGITAAVVGPESPPQAEAGADYTLSSVSEVEKFLIWLAGQTSRSAP